MTVYVGTYSIAFAALVAAGSLLVSLAAVRFGEPSLRRIARQGTYLIASLLTVSSLALLVALVRGEYHIEYVARHSNASLPTGYKLAAFWAGAEGSWLLWGWLIAVMGALFALCYRNEEGKEHSVALAVVTVVTAFFVIVLLFAADPFKVSEGMARSGRGLNPLLQNPWMISHPPTLFIGYAGYTFPFALMIGSLVAGRTDDRWAKQARPWSVFSWILLGLGIILGAKWAYVELGWGGYWGWDPVENASLLPWLTGTALLHSTIGQNQRGMFRRWNAALAAITFVLCILATYITRSGVISSVHTFQGSPVGDFCMGLMVVATLATIGLLAWRWSRLAPSNEMGGMVTREAGFMAANVLLVTMMAVVAIATLLPALSKLFIGRTATVKPEFYNRTVLPMGLALAAAMAVAPLLGYGAEAWKRVQRGIVLPAVLAFGVLVGLCSMGIVNPWALAAGAVLPVMVGSILVDAIEAVRARRANRGEGLVPALVRSVAANHRRYGAHLVHAGVAIMVVGIAGSGLYADKVEKALAIGDKVTVNGYEVTLRELHVTSRSNHLYYAARVDVKGPDGRTFELAPEERFYYGDQSAAEVEVRAAEGKRVGVRLTDWNRTLGEATVELSQGGARESVRAKVGRPAKALGYDVSLGAVEVIETHRDIPGPMGTTQHQDVMMMAAQVTLARDGGSWTAIPAYALTGEEQKTSEVALDSTWRKDLYVTLGGADLRTGEAALAVVVNPLVMWIWIGGIVMTVGAAVCLVPRLGRRISEKQVARATAAAGKPGAFEPAIESPEKRAGKKSRRGARGEAPVGAGR